MPSAHRFLFLPYSSSLYGSFGSFTDVLPLAGKLLAWVIVEGIISLFLFSSAFVCFMLPAGPASFRLADLCRASFLPTCHLRQPPYAPLSIMTRRVPLAFERHLSRASLSSACATVVVSLSLQGTASSFPIPEKAHILALPSLEKISFIVRLSRRFSQPR